MKNIGSIRAHSTSIVKAFTWRIIATTITTLLVFFITGKLVLALEVGALDIVIKLVAYYFHERGWLRYSNGSLDTRRPGAVRKKIRKMLEWYAAAVAFAESNQPIGDLDGEVQGKSEDSTVEHHPIQDKRDD